MKTTRVYGKDRRHVNFASKVNVCVHSSVMVAMVSKFLQKMVIPSAATLFFLLVISEVLISFSVGGEDLYGILDLSRSATTPQIKKSYRKMVKKW